MLRETAASAGRGAACGAGAIDKPLVLAAFKTSSPALIGSPTPGVSVRPLAAPC